MWGLTEYLHARAAIAEIESLGWSVQHDETNTRWLVRPPEEIRRRLGREWFDMNLTDLDEVREFVGRAREPKIWRRDDPVPTVRYYVTGVTVDRSRTSRQPTHHSGRTLDNRDR